MSIFNLPLIQSFAPLLEKSINGALAMDPAAGKKLKPLNGCILEINITNIDQSIFLGAQNSEIFLLSAEKAPTVTLSGSLAGFARLATTSNKTAAIKQHGIELTGDAVRAQQIQQIAKSMNIDWEALLAEVIGDTPAAFLSKGVKQSLNMAQSLSRNFMSDIEEFIKYELRLLPSKARIAAQFDAIDSLRLNADRLEARIRKLVPSSKRSK